MVVLYEDCTVFMEVALQLGRLAPSKTLRLSSLYLTRKMFPTVDSSLSI